MTAPDFWVPPVAEGELALPLAVALPLGEEPDVEAPGGRAVVAGYAAPAALISKGWEVA